MSRIGFACEYGEKKGRLSGISRCAQSCINSIINQASDNEYMFIGNDEFDLPIKKIPTINMQNKNKIYDCYSDIYDINIFHSFWMPYIGSKANVKRVYTIYDICPLVNIEWYDNKSGIYNFYDIHVREQLKYYDKIIAISQATKDDILKYFPNADEEKIEVVYLGNESSLSLSNYSSDVTSDKFDLRDGYILSVNTLVKRKNIEGTIAAFEQYKLSHPQSRLKLVLTGRVEKTNDIYQKIVSSKCKDSIVVTGYVSDVELLSLYCNALCVMYPSFYEGFGLPILEAMSLGKTVITSDISSMPEVGGDGVHYCDPYDVESIAYGIEKVCDDEAYRKGLEEKALIQAQKFSYEKAARETLEIYRSLI